MKAKIFLSCGQGPKEAPCAKAIAASLERLGFQCYVAVEARSPRGLRENIFAELESSDYFVMVDFLREKLNGTDDAQPAVVHRGSLFTHQELAIASFMELPILPFQEEGLKPLDGMLGVIQGNSIKFHPAARANLPDIVAGTVAKEDWSPTSKNCLTLELSRATPISVEVDSRRQSRFFHIAVKNNHCRKRATNCMAYLDSINGETRPTVELKWAGVTLPAVGIGSQSERKFDAFHFPALMGSRPIFNAYSDSSDYWPTLPGNDKECTLQYSVVADNFAPASIVLKVKWKDWNSVFICDEEWPLPPIAPTQSDFTRTPSLTVSGFDSTIGITGPDFQPNT